MICVNCGRSISEWFAFACNPGHVHVADNASERAPRGEEGRVEIDYTVTLDYGDDGPEEGEPTPTAEDMERIVRVGMTRTNWRSADVVVQKQ